MPSASKKQHNFMAAIANSSAFAKKAGVPMSVGKDFMTADKGKKFKGGGMAHPDIKEDKKLIKRAFKMHDEQEHQGKHTNLNKLKKGGLAMKKTFKDMEKNEVEFMRKKGAPSSMIKHEKKEMSEEKGEPMCGGGKVKKMAAGGKAKIDPKVVASLNAQAARGPAAPTPTMPMTAPPVARPPMAAVNPARPPMAPAPVRPPMAPTPMKKGGKVKETMGPRTMAKDVEKGSNKLLKFGESAVQKRGHTKGMEERGYKVEKIQGGAKGGKGVYGAKPIKMAAGGSTSSRGDGIAQRGRTKTKYC